MSLSSEAASTKDAHQFLWARWDAMKVRTERVSAPSYSRYFELSEDRSTGTYVKTNKLGSPTSCVHCQPL
jgi:hypothetical protein